MKKNKEKDVKKKQEPSIIKDVNADTSEVKKFVLILIGVAIVAVILYFVSAKYLIKDNFQDTNKDNNTEETIQYDSINVGSVFNRLEDEYYVFAYDPDSLKASIYASLLNSASLTKAKIYFLDLSVGINKKYMGDSSNKEASKASELSLVEPTLIKIEKGKVSKYLDTLEEIEKELK